MVVFTCNLCGESVKKSVVEKHYMTKCRRANKSVSCMDCLKDFYDNEYVAHTKCITELQKYSGKDYVHKEPNNSNGKKQEGWMDIVRSILDSNVYKLDAQTRAAFERLQSVENVPRKKAKFVNFANNCLRMYKLTIDKVWQVLEKELEKMKETKAAAAAAKKLLAAPAKNSETEKHLQENGSNDSKNEKSTKKKKSKHTKHDDADTKEDLPVKTNKKANGEVTQNGLKRTAAVDEDKAGEECAPKKKKSKKNNIAEDANASLPAVELAKDENTDDFQWSAVIERIVSKHKDGITTQKLQKKLLKKYLAKLAVQELTEKQTKKFDKKFSKNIKRCPAVQLNGELATPC